MMQLRKGVINFVDNAGAKMQTAQIEGIAGELANGVENYQPFGFTSHVVPCDPVTGEGAEIILGDLGSASQRTILACSDRRYRPRYSNPGDVLLYGINDAQDAESHAEAKQRFLLSADGWSMLKIQNSLISISPLDVITINNAHATVIIAADGTMSITAPTLNITSNVNITGNLTVSGNVTNASKNISKTHTHTGVTTGSGTTGQVS
jgi:phage gp45-like